MSTSISRSTCHQKTLLQALRTQVLTALTSSFGLVWWVWFGRFGLVGSAYSAYFCILVNKGQFTQFSTRSWHQVCELVTDMGRLWSDLGPIKISPTFSITKIQSKNKISIILFMPAKIVIINKVTQVMRPSLSSWWYWPWPQGMGLAPICTVPPSASWKHLPRLLLPLSMSENC